MDPETLVNIGIVTEAESENVPAYHEVVEYDGRRYVFDFGGLKERIMQDFHAEIDTPFSPYFRDSEAFLTLRTFVYPVNSDAFENAIRAGKYPQHSTDLICHAENLRVPHWKMHQERIRLPFVILHEWPKSHVEGKMGRMRFELTAFCWLRQLTMSRQML